MIVPTSTGSVPSTPAVPTGPKLPPEPFLMMAAAQMHREGRLVQSIYGEPDTSKSRDEDTKSPPPEEYFPSDGNRKGPAMMTQDTRTSKAL